MIPIHVIGIQMDPMPGPLVLLPFMLARSHLEFSVRDEDHR